MVGNYRRFIFKFNLQLKLRLFICFLEKKKFPLIFKLKLWVLFCCQKMGGGKIIIFLFLLESPLAAPMATGGGHSPLNVDGSAL